MRKHKKFARFVRNQGSISLPLLVVTGSTLTVLYGILMVLGLQLEYANRQTASEQALNIAEAGIEYYRWHLAHDKDDFTDGTGQAGPYTHAYVDPQGTEVGSYTLDILPPVNGSSIVTIRSTGSSKLRPGVKRTIEARYGIPSLSAYAFLQHGIMWYGSGLTINGPVHSNIGMRMDAVNNALATSYQGSYLCGGETGCNPPANRNGVWGSGPNTSLWEYPSELHDFNLIAFNFDSMQDEAIANGLHLGDSGRDGYHLVFQNNGTVRVLRVTRTSSVNGQYTPGQGLEGIAGDPVCANTNQVITNESLIGTYTLSENPIIFAEDDLWVEGIVKGRVTVAAVRFPTATTNTNIWIRNNITYTTYDGSDVLGLIAENDIYFVRSVPNNFRIDAALMAQSGQIIRHRYYNNCGGTTSAVRNSLTIYGAVISYFKSYWNYGDPPSSGFLTRQIIFDPHLRFGPPPYFPTGGDYEFISWKEE